MNAELQPLGVEAGIERYLQKRKPELEDSSYSNAITRLNHFQRWASEQNITNLNDLTGRELADFVHWRRDQIAPITLQKQLSSVRSALRYWADIEAVESGLAEKLHAPELPDGAESREEHLPVDRARTILSSLEKYEYSSPRHALLLLLWVTGMRRSATRSIDVTDFYPDEHAISLKHRPDTDTRLKNKESGERWVYLGPKVYQVLEDSLSHPDRFDRVDEHNRKPLFTTRFGRAHGTTLYDWINRVTQPCEYGPCPHDTEPTECAARGHDGQASKCPSAVGPHAIRRGAITNHLNQGVAPEVVSERCDVSLEVLYRHYDVRTDREKMSVRKNLMGELL